MGVISKATGGRRTRVASGVVSAQERAAGRSHQSPPRERPAHRRVVVGVDGSPNSAAAFQRAASQARQRNAMLDVVYVLPDDGDERAATMARVMLGEFTRQQCPYGVGAPVRLRVERGDPQMVLLLVGAGAELLIIGCQYPPSTGTYLQPAPPRTAQATRGPAWAPAPIGAPSSWNSPPLLG